jgi:hypothetical protein
MITTDQNTELQVTDALPFDFADGVEFDDEVGDDCSL